jgi:hypothetical protein
MAVLVYLLKGIFTTGLYNLGGRSRARALRRRVELRAGRRVLVGWRALAAVAGAGRVALAAAQHRRRWGGRQVSTSLSD